MPNITLAIDESTYRAARVIAAQRNATVSSMVRDYLRSLTGGQQASSREDQLFATLDQFKGFSAADRLTRDEAHRRR